MPIQVDWGTVPISIKCPIKDELIQFLSFLNNNGLKKHSIIMPDRESGGFTFLIYESIRKEIVENYIKEGE